MLETTQRVGWFLGIAIAGTIIACSASCTAQITPDSTLPNNSRVTPSDNTSIIEGGTQAGKNLFHSFQEFSVPTGSTAFFNNALDIQNIISRVTSGSISNIDGLIRANGTANLFLVNPNGIIFGQNASLNIGGSFVASTANALQFGNFGVFSATDKNVPSPLLTINPSALLFNQINSAPITNNSIAFAGFAPSGFPILGLQVPNGKNLALVGGSVNIDNGGIYAFGGRIEIGGLTGIGTVDLNADGSLGFPENVERADISLKNIARLDVTGENGGSITINSRNLDILGGFGGSFVLAGVGSDLGSTNTQAGNITFNSTESIKIDESSTVRNKVNPGAIGNGGDIRIIGKSLLVNNGSRLISTTNGQGNAGNISIQTSDIVSVDLQSKLINTVEQTGKGNAGNININSGSFSLLNGAELQATSAGEGNSGNITIDVNGITTFDQSIVNNGIAESPAKGQGGDIRIYADKLFVTNNSQLATATLGQGNAGHLILDIRDSAQFNGGFAFSYVDNIANGRSGDIRVNTNLLSLTNGSRLQTNTSGLGDAGSVIVNTGSIYLSNGAELISNSFSRGNPGNIIINAQDVVLFDGSNAVSSIEAQGIGKGGDIRINTGSLSVSNGAQLTASSSGQGNTGSVILDIRDNAVFNGGFAFSSIEAQGVGEGGDIRINTGSLSISNGGQVAAGTRGKGNAGSVIINSRDKVSLDGGGIFSLVGSTAIGNGKEIQINSTDVDITNDSQLVATTRGQGNAGNININARNTISFANRGSAFSRVEENATGQGGKINIAARVISLVNGSQLTTATLGLGNAGDIKINALDSILFDGKDEQDQPSAAFSAVFENAKGNGGNITINTRALSINNYAQLVAGSRGQGNAGNIFINAGDRVSFEGNSTAFSSIEPTSTGEGGDIYINTKSFFLSQGAFLSASTFGQGNAGNIFIDATDVVSLDGVRTNGSSSGLLTATASGANGRGGAIAIANTDLFRLTNGAVINALTANSNAGGTVNISVDRFEAINGGQIVTTTRSNGRAGKITVNATDKVIISGSDPNYNNRIVTFPNSVTNIGANSGFFVSSTSSGITGDIEINSPKITLDNQGKLNADSASGGGGNINVNSDLLLLRRNSQISTNAGTDQQGGDGGNINIDSKFIVAVPNENSDITANAFNGAGGKIQINATNIFGIAPLSRQDLEKLRPLDLDPSQLPTNDITAVSQANPSLSGTVQINTPDADPSRGLVELPTNLVDVSGQIANGCAPGSRQSKSSFIATGRGGLPISPNQPLQDTSMLSEWVRVREKPVTSSQVQVAPILTKSATQIVEAQGWVVDGNGDIVLVTQVPQVNPRSSWQAPVSCPAS